MYIYEGELNEKLEYLYIILIALLTFHWTLPRI